MHLRSFCLCICLCVHCTRLCVFVHIWNINWVLHEHVSDLLDIQMIIERRYTIHQPSATTIGKIYCYNIDTCYCWTLELCSMSQSAFHPFYYALFVVSVALQSLMLNALFFIILNFNSFTQFSIVLQTWKLDGFSSSKYR